MLATVADLSAASADIAQVHLGQVGIGPIHVRELTLSGTEFSMTGARGVLQGVHVTVTVHVAVEWHIHVPMPPLIPDIDVGDTVQVGPFTFSMPAGDITLPHLDDLHFSLPSVSAQDVQVPATVLTVDLTRAHAEGVHASGTTLPSAGFLLAGLSLTGLEADAVSVPAIGIERVAVRSFTADPLRVPALSLPGVTLPTAQVPVVNSTAPLDIPADLQEVARGFNADVLRVVLRVRPSVVTHVERLELRDAHASAHVGPVVLHDVVLPFEVHDLTLSQLGIDSVDVPVLSVT